MDINDNVLFKSRIFKHAYKIYDGFVSVADVTENSIIYSAIDLVSDKEHFVIMKYDHRSKTCGVECDCTIQALKSKNKPLCAHIVACMMHAGFQLGRPRKKVKKIA